MKNKIKAVHFGKNINIIHPTTNTFVMNAIQNNSQLYKRSYSTSFIRIFPIQN